MGGNKKKKAAKSSSTSKEPKPQSSKQSDSATNKNSRTAAGGIRTFRNCVLVSRKNRESADYYDYNEPGRCKFGCHRIQPTSRTSIMFAGNRRLNKAPPGNSPIDYFYLMLGDRFVNSLVDKINSNIKRSEGSKGPTVRIKCSEKVTRGEFEVFLALLYLMGFEKFSEIEDYWKIHHFLFNNYMSYRRFMQILNCIDFSDMTNPEASRWEELSRIQPLLDMFVERANEIYTPGKELMIEKPFTIADSNRNEGVKVYTLAEPTGLVINVHMCGINDKKLHSKDHGFKVVEKLMEKYHFVGHSLYLSDLYGSMEIALEMLRNNTNTTAKLKNAKMNCLSSLVNKNLSCEEVIQHFTNDEVCVIKWCDSQKNNVFMLSTEFTGTITNTKLDDKVSCMPHMLGWFKLYMYSFRAAQFMDNYPLEKNDIRWYLKVAINIFYTILYNSHILYYLFSGKYMHLIIFQGTIIKALLSKYLNSSLRKMSFHQRTYQFNYPERPQPQTSHNQRVDQLIYHQQSPLLAVFQKSPIHVPGIKKKIGGRPEPCRLCFRRGILNEVKTYCTNCDEQPVLCIPNCFQKYHRY